MNLDLTPDDLSFIASIFSAFILAPVLLTSGAALAVKVMRNGKARHRAPQTPKRGRPNHYFPFSQTGV